jgi:hypothetical protein
MSDTDPTAVDAQPPHAGRHPKRRKRPTEVWIVVVLGLVQGLVALAAAGLILYARSDPEIIELIAEEDPDLDRTALVVFAVVVGSVGLLNTALALLLAAGSRVVRAIYAAIATVEIAAATYGLVAVRDFRTAAVGALLYPVAIVWLLYGSSNSVRFFDS